MKLTNRWSASDRQAFADGNRLRASSIPGRRSSGPEIEDWGHFPCEYKARNQCDCRNFCHHFDEERAQ